MEKRKIEKFSFSKDKISKEIEQIQSECSHSDKHIKFVVDDKGKHLNLCGFVNYVKKY